MITVQIRADSRYPIDRKRVRLVVEKSLEREGVTSETVVSLAVVGRRQMKKVNAQFHGEDTVTDVLSFPFTDPSSSRDMGKFVAVSEEGLQLGDIMICYPVAVAQAREKNTLVDAEIDFLIEHGLQHLLGHHHE